PQITNLRLERRRTKPGESHAKAIVPSLRRRRFYWLALSLGKPTPKPRAEPRISQHNHKFSRLFNERPAEDRDPMRSSSRCRQNTRRLAKTKKRTSALLSGISNFSRSSSLHFIACQRLFHIRLGNSELSSNP